MSVQTKRPNANFLVTLTPTTINWQDTSDINDLSYVAQDFAIGNSDDLYTLDGILPVGATAISLVVWIRCCKMISGAVKICRGSTIIRENAVTTYGVINTLNVLWTNYSSAYANRPSDGLAWTVADVNNLLGGVRLYNQSFLDTIAVCSECWIVVTYTDPAGNLRRRRVGLGL